MTPNANELMARVRERYRDTETDFTSNSEAVIKANNQADSLSAVIARINALHGLNSIDRDAALANPATP